MGLNTAPELSGSAGRPAAGGIIARIKNLKRKKTEYVVVYGSGISSPANGALASLKRYACSQKESATSPMLPPYRSTIGKRVIQFRLGGFTLRIPSVRLVILPQVLGFANETLRFNTSDERL